MVPDSLNSGFATFLLLHCYFFVAYILLFSLLHCHPSWPKPDYLFYLLCKGGSSASSKNIHPRTGTMWKSQDLKSGNNIFCDKAKLSTSCTWALNKIRWLGMKIFFSHLYEISHWYKWTMRAKKTKIAEFSRFRYCQFFYLGK